MEPRGKEREPEGSFWKAASLPRPRSSEDNPPRRVALIHGWGPGSNWQEWDQLELGTCRSPGKGRSWVGAKAASPCPAFRSQQLVPGPSLLASHCLSQRKGSEPRAECMCPWQQPERKGGEDRAAVLGFSSRPTTPRREANTRAPQLSIHQGPHTCKAAAGLCSRCPWDEGRDL